MYRFLAAVLLATVCAHPAYSVPGQPMHTQTDTLWFKPELAENNDAVCGKVLADAQAYFVTEKSTDEHYFPWDSQQANVAGMTSVALGSDPATVEVNGKSLYLHVYTHPGCGGACETYQQVASPKPDRDDLEQRLSVSPPAASRFRLYEDMDKSLWLYLLDEHGNLLVYKLLETGEWKRSCKVLFHPERLEESSDPEIRRAHNSLSDIKAAVGGLTRGAGSCGSMATHARWARSFSFILPVTLYRPWALKDFDDDYGTYDKDLAGLAGWSLTGVSEYASFRRYREQFGATAKSLAHFYHVKFGWDPKRSEQLAESALSAAVSSTIRFYEYVPFRTEAEGDLRKAILELQPMKKIMDEMYIDPDTLKAKDGEESVLSVAIVHPAAMKYLLDKGLRANQENAFGKTPLMYAVQWNQLESVKLLLNAGAYPNARTTKPVDNCFYTLETFGMTPLHYAVRYASPEVIRLLLEKGASPDIQAERSYRKETPLDWFDRYTRPGADEPNPNISAESIPEVRGWLEAMRARDLPALVDGTVLRAEELYQKGKITEAYQALGVAMALAPDNERALSDMSLIALRNEKLGQSIEAGKRLIKKAGPTKLKANAWFNQGLACERYISDNQGGYLPYNGSYHCTYGFIYPFYKAIKAEYSEGRKNKLLSVFEAPGNYCDIPERGIKINFQMGRDPEVSGHRQLQTLFVLHQKDVNISERDLAWTTRFYEGARSYAKLIVPKMVDSVVLGDKRMSVFSTSESYSAFPYEAFGFQCSDGKSLARKVPVKKGAE